MKIDLSAIFEIGGAIRPGASLDLVVPFTTPHLTEVALRAAGSLGAGLDSVLRVVKVQVVPFPLDLQRSPIPQEFLEAQMEKLCCATQFPAATQICFAREFEQGLLSVLRYRSLVVLAYRKRPWRTRTERLAQSLRKAGYSVVLVPEEGRNA